MAISTPYDTAYQRAYLQTMRERQREELRNQQQMIRPGNWSGQELSWNDPRQQYGSVRTSQYWISEECYDTGKKKWRLNKQKVYNKLMELGVSLPEHPQYHLLKSGPHEFDKYFGPGAYNAYTESGDWHERKGKPTKKRSAFSGNKPMESSGLIMNPVRKLVVPDSKTLAEVLSDNHDERMQKATKESFYVGKHETMLEALQREYDIFVKGISIRADNRFIYTTGTAVTMTNCSTTIGTFNS